MTTVAETNEHEGPRKGILMSRLEDDGYAFDEPRAEKEKSLRLKDSKSSVLSARKMKASESDKDYFNNLLAKNLHLNSDDIATIHTKKAGSKGPQRALFKASALLELSSLLIEIEKQVTLNCDHDEPLLTLLFLNIAELVCRVQGSAYCRLFLVDRKKVGGIVLFSRGGYDAKGDAGDGLILLFHLFFIRPMYDLFHLSSPNVCRG